MSFPNSGSSAEIVATWAFSSLVETGFESCFKNTITRSFAFSIPLRKAKGFAPAVTFFNPSPIIAWPSTVAVVVPSPAMSFALEATSFTISAPMFSILSSSSIFFAMVTPSLVIVGEPKPSSSTTFLPFGPSVTLTALASLSTPALSFLRASSLYNICFAM